MVRIITDSSADLEPQEYQQLGIISIPLIVSFGQKEYQENVDLSKDQFYQLLAQSPEGPKTSQPSPETVETLLRQAMEAGDETVVIPISSGLSGTMNSIHTIKNLLGYEDCYIVDSLTATGGLRLLVEQAAKMRDQGCSAREIAEFLPKLREQSVLYACIDTLEYLMKGGRISKSVYTVGTLANIKPIIRVSEEGTIVVPAKAMGMKKGMAYLCKVVQEHQPDPEYPLYVMYTHDRTNAQTLAKKLEEMGYDIPQERIIPVGAAIGSHIGSNAVGLVYAQKA